MKKFAVSAAMLGLLCFSADAAVPDLAQRTALGRLYDLESIMAHCRLDMNYEKIDRDLSVIKMSVADYCPDGRFNKYASPNLNEPSSRMMKRLSTDYAILCAEALNVYGPEGSAYKNWLMKARDPSSEIGLNNVCSHD